MSLSLLLLLYLAGCASAGVTYTMKVYTADVRHAGTNSDITVQLFGSKGSTVGWLSCNIRGNDFVRGGSDTYTFANQLDVGDILCVTFKTAGNDALLIEKTEVSSSGTSPPVVITNTARESLSRNSGEGAGSIKTCISNCAAALPLTAKDWQLEKDEIDVRADANVELLQDKVLSTVVVDARNSNLTKETKFHVTGEMTTYSIFKQTGGPFSIESLSFSANYPYTINGIAFLSSDPDTFTMGTPSTSSLQQAEEDYWCTAPAGTAVKCSVVMKKTKLTVPFTQTWVSKDGKCRTGMQVSGVFTRTEESDMFQLNVMFG